VAAPPVQSSHPAPSRPQPRHLALVLTIVVGADAVGFVLLRWLFPSADPVLFGALNTALAVALAAPLLWWLTVLPLHRRALAERVRTEEALRAAGRSEAQYRAIVETANEGIWVLGPDGVTTYANRRLCEMLGYAADEIVGRTFFDFMDEQARALARLVHGKSGLGFVDTYDFRFRRGDGSDLWAVVCATSMPGPESGVLVMLTDITERKRIEDENRRLAEAIDQAADSVFITDADGIIVWANAAFERITGYGRADALGKSPRILKSGAHEDGFFEDLWRTIRSGRVFRGMMINKRKSGETYYLDESITPIINESGRITHFVAAGREIAAGDLAAMVRRVPS
jgi:PAS domain S-box-containing protein